MVWAEALLAKAQQKRNLRKKTTALLGNLEAKLHLLKLKQASDSPAATPEATPGYCQLQACVVDSMTVAMVLLDLGAKCLQAVVECMVLHL